MRRSREEGNRAPDCITSAIYLFYPGGWIKLVYGTRTPRAVRARCAEKCAQSWPESADLPVMNDDSIRLGVDARVPRFSDVQKGNGTKRREKIASACSEVACQACYFVSFKIGEQFVVFFFRRNERRVKVSCLSFDKITTMIQTPLRNNT